MSKQQHHKVHTEEYEAATLEAFGAIIGWCGGKGEDPPYLTPVLKEAFERAFAVAFDRGVEVGRKAAV